MSTLTTRAFIACVSITSTVLFAPAATAQLRQHPVVAGMGPTQFDIEPEPDFIDQPNFGAAVAIRNGVAFVGIPGIRGGQGGVRIFTQSSTGAWVNSGTLTVSGAWGLGRSLTFRDGVLVAGAASLDSKPNAYVFRRVNGVWTQTQKLTPPAGDNVDTFADSLRYENGTLAVAANASRRFSSDKPGVVYIFVADATGKLIRRARLTGNNVSQDLFGEDISMAGPVMVIGSSGAAFIFRRDSTGVWRRHQKLVSPSGDADGFGAAVAIDRSMIIVGAPGARNDDPQGGFICYGAAYGFAPSAGRWFSTFVLQPRPADVELCEKFGSRIAMSGNRIAIASSEIEFRSEGDVPSQTFVFTYTRADWTVVPRGLTRQAVLFGVENLSMSLSNNLLFVGMRCHHDTFCIGGAAMYDLNRFVQ